MKDTKEKGNKINFIAIIIAFVFGITIGRTNFGAMFNEPSEKVSRGETTQVSAVNFTETTRENVTVKAVTSSEVTLTSSATTAVTKEDLSDMVYRTPTGKRYHLDPDCAGVNRIESTVDESTALGLTPCKKCADG